MSKTRNQFPRRRAASNPDGAAGETSDREEPVPVSPVPEIAHSGRSLTLGARLRDTVFFILFWFYLWRVVDLRLIAHCAGPPSGDLPVFYRGWTFFRDLVGHPGGSAEYAGAFLFQLFTHAWLGALVVTGLAWMLYLCVSGCFSVLGRPRLACLRHVPAFLLLAIYSQYAHCITGIVALLAAICLIPLYQKISANGTPAAMAFFIVVSPALYYIAGATYLVFAATCILHETLITRRWRLVGCCLIVVAAVPCLIGVILAGSSLTTAFTPYAFYWNVAIPGQPLRAIWLLHLLMPAGLLLTGVAEWIDRRRIPAPMAGAGKAPTTDRPSKTHKRSAPGKTNKKPAAGGPWYARAPGLVRFAGWLFPFVIAAGVARSTFAAGEKCLRAVDFHAYHGMWQQVLDASHADPANPANMLTVDRALYHTGRLADEMFSHPQNISALLIGTEGSLCWQWTGIWLDAGFVNAAEHNLAQLQEVVGEQPAILQQLALIHMAKGNTGTARIYLKALARTLTLNDWAAKYLIDLERDPELSQNAQIQWLRSTMPKTAVLIGQNATGDWFLELLNRNPKNRPAFEYLMALCLMAARPDKVVENIHRLNDFDYARPYLPEHYAEAVVFCMANNGLNPDLHGWQIREETRQRFRSCMEIARRHKDDRPAMTSELRQKFPGSYFRYLLTRESGIP